MDKQETSWQENRKKSTPENSVCKTMFLRKTSYLDGPGAVVLNLGLFAPKEYLAISGDILGCHNLGKYSISMHWTEASC